MDEGLEDVDAWLTLEELEFAKFRHVFFADDESGFSVDYPVDAPVEQYKRRFVTSSWGLDVIELMLQSPGKISLSDLTESWNQKYPNRTMPSIPQMKNYYYAILRKNRLPNCVYTELLDRYTSLGRAPGTAEISRVCGPDSVKKHKSYEFSLWERAVLSTKSIPLIGESFTEMTETQFKLMLQVIFENRS